MRNIVSAIPIILYLLDIGLKIITQAQKVNKQAYVCQFIITHCTPHLHLNRQLTELSIRKTHNGLNLFQKEV